MKVILQNEQYSRVITFKDSDIDLTHYDGIWDMYVRTEFAGIPVDVCITGDLTDGECPGIDYTAPVRVEAYKKESDTNLFECRSPIVQDEYSRELQSATPEELIRQMAQIAVPIILGTRFLRDFSLHDSDFVKRTDAKHPFLWLVRENGTSLYDLTRKDSADGFRYTMEQYRDECYLFHYNGYYLRPIITKDALSMLDKLTK
ncbi:MAG: hypothetical protein LBV38_00855 [Alistipes sp.]|jgi:hypothetical protein|nr:hypothetical protein [Alistipes sp.]